MAQPGGAVQIGTGKLHVPSATPQAPPHSPSAIAPLEVRIRLVRGVRLLLDSDLAELYGVSTKLRRAGVVTREWLLMVDKLSERVDRHDAAISTLVKSLRALVESPVKSRPIGFTADVGAKPESSRY